MDDAPPWSDLARLVGGLRDATENGGVPDDLVEETAATLTGAARELPGANPDRARLEQMAVLLRGAMGKPAERAVAVFRLVQDCLEGSA